MSTKTLLLTEETWPLVARLSDHVNEDSDLLNVERDRRFAADLLAWNSMGDEGIALLEEVARIATGPRPTRLRRGPRGRWHLPSGRFSFALDLLRRIREEGLDPDEVAAGAVHMLGALGPKDAGHRLLRLFAYDPPLGDEDFWSDLLAGLYLPLGAEALPLLRSVVENHKIPTHGRTWAFEILSRLVKENPDLRAACIEILCLPLQEGYAIDAEDEAVAGFAVVELGHLGASEALPRIEDAWARQAIDPQVVDLEWVQRQLGDGRTLSMPRSTTRQGLTLHCTACGRTREHRIRHAAVLEDLLEEEERFTGPDVDREQRKLALRFGPLLIPHPVSCPRCGAVNRYRITPLTYAELTREMMGRAEGAAPQFPWLHFLRRPRGKGLGHPAVAAWLYRGMVEEHPDDCHLRLALANALRESGQWDEARPVYLAVAQHEAASPGLKAQAAYHLALLEAADGRADAAAEWCHIGLEVLPKALPREEHPLVPSLRSLLAEVSDARAFDPQKAFDELCQLALMDGAKLGAIKVGRNDPCPCGSGKKFKKCCGR